MSSSFDCLLAHGVHMDVHNAPHSFASTAYTAQGTTHVVAMRDTSSMCFRDISALSQYATTHGSTTLLVSAKTTLAAWWAAKSSLLVSDQVLKSGGTVTVPAYNALGMHNSATKHANIV